MATSASCPFSASATTSSNDKSKKKENDEEQTKTLPVLKNELKDWQKSKDHSRKVTCFLSVVTVLLVLVFAFYSVYGRPKYSSYNNDGDAFAENTKDNNNKRTYRLSRSFNDASLPRSHNDNDDDDYGYDYQAVKKNNNKNSENLNAADHVEQLLMNGAVVVSQQNSNKKKFQQQEQKQSAAENEHKKKITTGYINTNVEPSELHSAIDQLQTVLKHRSARIKSSNLNTHVSSVSELSAENPKLTPQEYDSYSVTALIKNCDLEATVDSLRRLGKVEDVNFKTQVVTNKKRQHHDRHDVVFVDADLEQELAEKRIQTLKDLFLVSASENVAVNETSASSSSSSKEPVEKNEEESVLNNNNNDNDSNKQKKYKKKSWRKLLKKIASAAAIASSPVSDSDSSSSSPATNSSSSSSSSRLSMKDRLEVLEKIFKEERLIKKLKVAVSASLNNNKNKKNNKKEEQQSEENKFPELSISLTVRNSEKAKRQTNSYERARRRFENIFQSLLVLNLISAFGLIFIAMWSGWSQMQEEKIKKEVEELEKKEAKCSSCSGLHLCSCAVGEKEKKENAEKKIKEREGGDNEGEKTPPALPIVEGEEMNEFDFLIDPSSSSSSSSVKKD